jgi:hypothetical protein
MVGRGVRLILGVEGGSILTAPRKAPIRQKAQGKSRQKAEKAANSRKSPQHVKQPSARQKAEKAPNNGDLSHFRGGKRQKYRQIAEITPNSRIPGLGGF